MNALISKLSVLAVLAFVASGCLHAAETERYPETKTRLLGAADIQGWDEGKLRYAINEMYARHGADFKDKKIKAWFKRFDWYKPRPGLDYDAVELEFTDIEKQNVKLLGEARQRPPTAPSGNTEATTPVIAAEEKPGRKPAAVSIVNQPPNKDYGDLQVRFADGQTEKWSDGGHCTEPDLSSNGSVGWIFGNEESADGHRIGKDVVRLRQAGGRKQDFAPNPKGGPFIEQWGFADEDAAIVIKSRGHHGPAFFIKYDIASHKVLGQQDGYLPENKMAPWAQPYSD